MRYHCTPLHLEETSTMPAEHELVEAAALELEDLRRGPLTASMLSASPPGRSASASPPTVPSTSFDSTADTSPGGGGRRSSDGCYGESGGDSSSSHGVGYRRSNTIAGSDVARHTQGSCPGRRFPANCLALVRGLPGNSRCVDCEEMNPEWASVSYGVLLCLRCSGRHRGLGVNNSVVKSIGMDGWSHSQIISMLEGGNDQLSGFFVRHSLCPKPAAASTGSGPGSGNSSGDEDSDVIMAKAAAAAAKAAAALSANQKPRAPSRSNSFCQLDEIIYIRYKTKAALFYRENLAKHVERVAADGQYRGREAARKRATGGGNKSGETSPTNLSAKASPSQPSPRAGMPPVSASASSAR